MNTLLKNVITVGGGRLPLWRDSVISLPPSAMVALYIITVRQYLLDLSHVTQPRNPPDEDAPSKWVKFRRAGQAQSDLCRRI